MSESLKSCIIALALAVLASACAGAKAAPAAHTNVPDQTAHEPLAMRPESSVAAATSPAAPSASEPQSTAPAPGPAVGAPEAAADAPTAALDAGVETGTQAPSEARTADAAPDSSTAAPRAVRVAELCRVARERLEQKPRVYLRFTLGEGGRNGFKRLLASMPRGSFGGLGDEEESSFKSMWVNRQGLTIVCKSRDINLQTVANW